jgi:2-polyprenyl-3-methyl-5-hydroxy-6-metoxy-1,4-benzoquinol methylase
MTDLKAHWEKIFGRKSSSEVSWYKPHLNISLQLIERSGIDKSASIIDIGGGDSALVDDLLEAGYANVTVLDISQAALDRARMRLGDRAGTVTWLNTDITQAELPAKSYDLWHDRAMLHFLINPDARSAYINLCKQAVKPGGSIIIATFADDGPEQCSGLPTMRYSSEELQQQFGSSFHLIEIVPEMHITPHGKQQSFVYCLLKKRA